MKLSNFRSFWSLIRAGIFGERINIDLSELPTDDEMRYSSVMSSLIVCSGVLFLGPFGLIAYGWGWESLLDWNSALIIAIGLTTLATGLYHLTFRSRVTIDGNKVIVVKRTLVGSKAFTEFLDAYRCVKLESRVIYSHKVHTIVKLVHSNPVWSVPIFSGKTLGPIDDRVLLQTVAQILNLPTGEPYYSNYEPLIEDPEQRVRERMEQVEKGSTVPSMPPPDGISIDEFGADILKVSGMSR